MRTTIGEFNIVDIFISLTIDEPPMPNKSITKGFQTTGFILLLALVMPSPSLALDKQQREAGFFVDHTVVRKEVLLYDDKLINQIVRIGQRVAQGAAKVKDVEEGNSNLIFRIINSPEINAAAAPGGLFYIYSGLLDFAESEDEIAWAIGHELAHFIENHYFQFLESLYSEAIIMERIKYGLMLTGGAFLGVVAATSAPRGITSQQRGTLFNLGVVAGGAATGLVLGKPAELVLTSLATGYKADLELEADRLAAIFVERAGYNPRAMIGLAKRFKYLEEKLEQERVRAQATTPPYVSHLINAKPGLDERIEELEKLYPSSKDFP